jgi:kinesin family protein 11
VVEGMNEEEISMRVKSKIGYRDFNLDGISLAEKEDLDGFYKNFIETRFMG